MTRDTSWPFVWLMDPALNVRRLYVDGEGERNKKIGAFGFAEHWGLLNPILPLQTVLFCHSGVDIPAAEIEVLFVLFH